MPRIVPNLWFDTQALEAAEFYVGIFPNSKILDVSYYTDAGPRDAGTVLTVEFELDGQRYTAINGGPQFTFDEAMSLLVDCGTQDEIDHYWDALLEGGGQESQCGWLKDKYGLSWQVGPADFNALVPEGDEAARDRAMQVMFTMQKLDLQAMRDAAAGKTSVT